MYIKLHNYYWWIKCWGFHLIIAKVYSSPIFHLVQYVSQDIVRIWMVKFGKPPVIRHGFPLPKIALYSIIYTSSWSSVSITTALCI